MYTQGQEQYDRIYMDANVLTGGITPEILKQLIERNEARRARCVRLKEYYRGNHAILHRVKDTRGAANQRVAANWAKYITTVSSSYLLGNPVTYDTKPEYDISPVLDGYRRQHISSVDAQLGVDASICGVGVEHVYVDENGEPHSTAISQGTAFVVYDDTVLHRKLLGIHYYEQRDLSGAVCGYGVTAADHQWVYHYAGRELSALDPVGAPEEHYFGAVPFIEYRNNEERQGDFEQQISLIDAYNTLMSDRVNDKVQFVDAFLLLLGIDIDSEQAKKLREEKILMGDVDAKAQYLSKVLSESDVEVLKKALKDDIFATSMVPDLSDENFGNNTSGVAIKYKLLVFEQMTLGKERLFEEGLRERLSMYIHFYSIKCNMQEVPVHEIDVHFKRNLPANELELSQIVGNLSGIASTETLLGILPFVCDAKEEAKLAAEEKAESEKSAILTQRELMRYGDDNAAE